MANRQRSVREDAPTQLVVVAVHLQLQHFRRPVEHNRPPQKEKEKAPRRPQPQHHILTLHTTSATTTTTISSMKFSLLFLLPAAATGFSVVLPTHSSRTAPSMRLYDRPDASAAIAAAVAAGKEFGPTSPEARVAWDIVEEMDASDNSQATAGDLDTECLVEDEVSKACTEYGGKLDTLFELVKENQPKIDQMKSLAQDLQNIKLSVSGSKGKPAENSPALQAALQEAKDTEEKYGKGSPEAVVAWAELEDVAASGLGNAIGGSILDDECLVDTAMDACKALDELNRVLEETKSS